MALWGSMCGILLCDLLWCGLLSLVTSGVLWFRTAVLCFALPWYGMLRADALLWSGVLCASCTV
eukprot:12895677-Prorocentrum_lima.AAC.1